MMLSLMCRFNLELEQMDVKTAFLHGDLEETILMKQPEGFKVQGIQNQVCKLKKSLYGLKQSPRQWYKKFDNFMMINGYTRSMYDSCVYLKKFNDGEMIYLLLYVNDMLIACRDNDEIKKLKFQLLSRFDMKDLGSAKKILGMEICRDRGAGKLVISQRNYIEKIVQKFNMNDAKVVSQPIAAHFKLSSLNSPSTDEEKKAMELVPYSSAVGSVMYIMICTRPDISHAVSLVSRFMANPGRQHWEAVKWIFRYLKGTSSIGLVYETKRENAGTALGLSILIMQGIWTREDL